MNEHYKIFLNHLLWFVLTFILLIGVETTLNSLMTGYQPTKFSFLLWDKFYFFLDYFREEPFDSLSFFLIDRPLFKIEAVQNNPTTVIWGLHFYSYTLVTHIIVAILASKIIVKHSLTISALRFFPVSSSILLILSSLFLYLSICCTSGANWMIHSWLLAIVFNPYNATETTLNIYLNILGWLIWMQLAMAASGVYLMTHRKRVQAKMPG